MIDDSCEVPREDLDEGFNPCRRQVKENGDLEAYAHMYDVMNERYDREEDTSWLNSVKLDKQTGPFDTEKVYAVAADGTQLMHSVSNSPGNIQSGNMALQTAGSIADYVASHIPDVSGLEAELDGKLDKLTSTSTRKRIYTVSEGGVQTVTPIQKDYSSSWVDGTTVPTTGAVAEYAPLPLPISKGGTGGNTPYVTDDLDASAIFVMHDAPNDRYDAAPMGALTNYLATKYPTYDNVSIPSGSDLNDYKTAGNYSVRTTSLVPSIVNAPADVSEAFNLYVVPVLTTSNHLSQYLVEYLSGKTYYRHYEQNSDLWRQWTMLYPTSGTSDAWTNSSPSQHDKANSIFGSRDLQGAAGNINVMCDGTAGPGYLGVTKTAGATGSKTGTLPTVACVRGEIEAAFGDKTATSVAANDLLPTNNLLIDYVAAHAGGGSVPGTLTFAITPRVGISDDRFASLGNMTVMVYPLNAVSASSDFGNERLYAAFSLGDPNGGFDSISYTISAGTDKATISIANPVLFDFSPFIDVVKSHYGVSTVTLGQATAMCCCTASCNDGTIKLGEKGNDDTALSTTNALLASDNDLSLYSPIRCTTTQQATVGFSIYGYGIVYFDFDL